MSYEPLAKLFHKDASPSRFAANERLAKERLEAISTFRTGIITKAGELFLAVPRELSLVNERVLRRERKVSALFRGLPPIARNSLIRGLVIDEVVSTNDLEGIHSTRRQIGELLEHRVPAKEGAGTLRRFKEFATLYLALSDPELSYPSSLEDLRSLYDTIMSGEELGENKPDGKLFRRGGVDIVGRGNRIVHTGLYPESAIMDALQSMLELVSSDDIPETYSAIMAHCLFEYVHPFYDGNGRCGRYLLALYLSRPLSILTSLSLSRAIAEHREVYYRSFKEVEDPLNHGELTFFVLAMLNTIEVAQSELIDRIEEKARELDRAHDGMAALAERYGIDDVKANIVFQVVQIDLFAAFPGVVLEDIAAHIGMGAQATRRHVKQLEELGLLRLAGKRPLRFVVATQAWEALEIDEPGR